VTKTEEMGAIKVIIIEKETGTVDFKNIYEVHVKPTPEFMMDPILTDNDKIKFISEEIGKEFYNFLKRNINDEKN